MKEVKNGLYNKVVLEHYKKPKNFGRLKSPSHQAEILNEICGDEISIELLVKNRKIKDIKFSAQGCALMIASASLLSERVKSQESKVKDIEKLQINEIEKLFGTTISSKRKQCVVLPITALKKALFDFD